MSARIIDLTAYRAQRERADARYAHGYAVGYDAGVRDGFELRLAESMLSCAVSAFLGAVVVAFIWAVVAWVRS